MLFGNQSISHYSPSNIFIWLVMAFQAGLLNIGGFMAGHQIVSHITGFATFFGASLGQRQWHQAFMMMLVPVFFLLGSMLSGHFVDIRLKLGKRPKYYITFGIMFFLILCVFLAGVTGHLGEFGHSPDVKKNYALLIVLCFVCGIQNGTISVVSKSMVRTTHLTGITTDLGLGLVRLMHKRKLPQLAHDERRANFMRVGIIFFFALGSAIGGFTFDAYQFYGFLIPVVISGPLFIGMLYFQVWKSPPQSNKV